MFANILRHVINAYKLNPGFMILLSLKAFAVFAISMILPATFFLTVFIFFTLPLAFCKPSLLRDITDSKQISCWKAFSLPTEDGWEFIKLSLRFLGMAILVVIAVYILIFPIPEHEEIDAILAFKIIIGLMIIIPCIIVLFVTRPFDIVKSLKYFECKECDLSHIHNIKPDLSILTICSSTLLLMPLICPIVVFGFLILYDDTVYTYLMINHTSVTSTILFAMPAVSAAIFLPIRGVVLAAASHEISRLAAELHTNAECG